MPVLVSWDRTVARIASRQSIDGDSSKRTPSRRSSAEVNTLDLFANTLTNPNKP